MYLFIKILKNLNFIKVNRLVNKKNMGIGDWGLGIGARAQSPIPNPQSPIPNPQSPLIIIYFIFIIN